MPLLIVRDPVAIWIYILAWREGIFPRRLGLSILYGIAILSLLVSLAFGQASLLVNLFGARTNFLHIPLLFLMSDVLRAEDVKRFGFAFLLLAAPMALLMACQFMSPPDAWINIGAGEGAGQIGTSLGHIRPAGLFSYNTGAGQYWAITTAIILSGCLKKTYPAWLLALAGASLMIGLISSGSRTTVISCGIVIAVFALCAFSPRRLFQIFAAVAAAGALGLLVSQLSLFREGVDTLTTRFDEGGGVQEGLVMRVWNDYTSPFEDVSLGGVGLGLGTNGGAQLTTGQVGFLVAEGEWGRVLGESGIILGLAFMLWRVFLAVDLLIASFRLRSETLLPLLLWAACGDLLVGGQWGQPTCLGFAIFGSGLCLVAINSIHEPVILVSGSEPAGGSAGEPINFLPT